MPLLVCQYYYLPALLFACDMFVVKRKHTTSTLCILPAVQIILSQAVFFPFQHNNLPIYSIIQKWQQLHVQNAFLSDYQ